MIENPVVLGAIVFILVWAIRKLAWDVNGIKAMWLTMAVSLGMALAEWVLSAGWAEITVCQFVLEPAAFLGCLVQTATMVVETAGVIFVSAQVIYKVLRLKLASELV